MTSEVGHLSVFYLAQNMSTIAIRANWWGERWNGLVMWKEWEMKNWQESETQKGEGKRKRGRKKIWWDDWLPVNANAWGYKQTWQRLAQFFLQRHIYTKYRNLEHLPAIGNVLLNIPCQREMRDNAAITAKTTLKRPADFPPSCHLG